MCTARCLVLFAGCAAASAANTTDLRLVGGTDRGRLEVYHDGQWGTVCDDGFNSKAARVACRQLGYSAGARYVSSAGTGPIWLDDVRCTGEEATFVSCQHAGWGRHNCHHSEDVALVCFEAGTEGPIDVRLTGGDRGRLEVKFLGEWGTVCDDGFTAKDAQVVCRQLGHAAGARYTAAPGSGPIWLDDMKCNGTETNLSFCPHAGWGMHNCRHSEDVAVICFDISDVSSISIRLSETDHGRLEVYFAGEWGTVCDDAFGEKDARVVCRQLGYTGDVRVLRGSQVPVGSGPIWLDDLRCTGAEGNLSDCRHGGWGAHNCIHREDVGVDCRVREAGLDLLESWLSPLRILLSFGVSLGGAVVFLFICLKERLRPGDCSALQPRADVANLVPAAVLGVSTLPAQGTAPVRQWEVVAGAGAKVHASPDTASFVCGMRHRGDVVSGQRHGDWVRLEGGLGFIILQEGSAAVLSEKTAVGDGGNDLERAAADSPGPRA